MSSLTSALTLDASLFDPATIPPETHAFNTHLQDIMSQGPKWYEVGAPKYREMRAAGQTPLPAATYLDSASDITIPSREPGRSIPCRLITPSDGTAPKSSIKGVFMHIHGGGWVLQDEKSQDPTLQLLANNTGLTCISIGYRLAPEHPFPTAQKTATTPPNTSNSPSHFGAPLSFIGGESAGAHLSLLVVLHLLHHRNKQFSEFTFKGLILHFGAYSLSWLPQVYSFQPSPILVLDKDLMDHYIDVFLPNYTEEQKKDPAVSPLYADLSLLRNRLPSALFTCGTCDCLLDDTIFMSAKWRMAGGEALVLIVPGVPHGYIMFPRDMKGSGADVGMRTVEEFIAEKLR